MTTNANETGAVRHFYNPHPGDETGPGVCLPPLVKLYLDSIDGKTVSVGTVMVALGAIGTGRPDWQSSVKDCGDYLQYSVRYIDRDYPRHHWRAIRCREPATPAPSEPAAEPASSRLHGRPLDEDGAIEFQNPPSEPAAEPASEPAGAVFSDCPECETGNLREATVENFDTKIKGKPITVPQAHIHKCDKCGCVYYGAREIRRWEELAKSEPAGGERELPDEQGAWERRPPCGPASEVLVRIQEGLYRYAGWLEAGRAYGLVCDLPRGNWHKAQYAGKGEEVENLKATIHIIEGGRRATEVALARANATITSQHQEIERLKADYEKQRQFICDERDSSTRRENELRQRVAALSDPTQSTPEEDEFYEKAESDHAN